MPGVTVDEGVKISKHDYLKWVLLGAIDVGVALKILETPFPAW